MRRPRAAAIALALMALAAAVTLFARNGAHTGLAASQTSGGFTTGAAVWPSSVAPGSTVSIGVGVIAANASSALVDVEVYGPVGRVEQSFYDGQTIAAGQTRTYSIEWSVPKNATAGTYSVKVGVFSAGWTTLYQWNNNAATFTVGATANATPTPRPTNTPPATANATRTATATATRTATATATRPATATATPTRQATGTATSTPGAGAGGSTTLPPLPAGWPSNTLQLGMADGPGDASALRQMAPFGFRYQYLAGGVNTGSGWATWNANGAFATNYIQDSVANGMTPVFTYYMIYQSAPGNAQGESSGVAANLQNSSTMSAYYNDLKLFFERAGAFPNNRVVLHVEPDMWGFTEQQATSDDASTVPVKMASTGMPELAGLPDNLAGFAQGVVRLRDRYAPNVILGYHISIWGTGNDFIYTNPSDATIDTLGTRAANFYNSLHANFDVAFAEFSDRDAAFKQYQYGDGGASWWDAGDFSRNARFLSKFVSLTGKRIVMWQIPLGNTKMRAMNNTWDHYQDNRVEWFLDDATRQHLQDYESAGVIAFLFGRGADGATCACDAAGDGVTNPAAINGNNGISTSADDDGGFFRQKSAAYYAAGAMALPSAGSAPVSSPPVSTPTATPTPVPPSQAPSFTLGASVSPSSVSAGGTVTITARVTSSVATSELIDIEVFAPDGSKVLQRFFDGQPLAAGSASSFPVSWQVPAGSASGMYTVKVGAFRVGWAALDAWNNAAATFAVN